MGIALCQTQFPVPGFKLSVGLLERGRSGCGSRGVQEVSSKSFLCAAPLRPHSRLQGRFNPTSWAMKKAHGDDSLAWSHTTDPQRVWN